MNIQHSSRTDKWGTPAQIVAMASGVLDGIDLDPASSPRFNTVVNAKRIITAEQNALATPWDAAGKSVFLNPPGGKLGNKSLTALFWAELMEYRHQFKHAIFLGFSLEALQTTQKHCPSIGEFSFCVPRKRIRFLTPDLTVGPAPSHSNVIAYVPGSVDESALFAQVFSELGVICNRKETKQ